MTHLRIELPTTGIEQVSSSVIEKLYNLAVSGDLDASSNLLGRLNVDGTYLEYIDELEDLFDELYISTTKIYIKFADPEVKRVLMANNIGDGIGITRSDAAALTGLFNGNSSSFMNNTTITSFDEFEYFGYTSLYSNQWEKGAFKGCTNLLSISLKNITSIGLFSFYLCSSLLTVKDFHATTIGMYAFNNTAVSSIDLSLVTDLDAAAFRNCTGLTTIDLSSLTSVRGSSSDNAVFKNCTGLTTVTNLNSTGLYMFYGCTGLTSVTLTQNCTNIGYAAFTGCSNLSSVSGLSNVTKIDGYGFSNCRNLSLNVSLLLNLQQIGSYTFAYDSLVTGDLNLPNITGSIGMGTFYNTSITKILSLGHIQSIESANSNAESRAFGGCASLIEVDLSTTTSLTSIGTASFVGCSALTLVKLPSSITSIGGWAFAGSQLMIQARTYYIYATTPPTLNARHSIGTEGSSVVLPAAIYVPAGSVEDYKAASIWSDFASVILAMPST